MGERLVELDHLLGARALLRTEYRRGAARAAQRVIHVGGHHHLDLRQPGVQTGQVYLTEARQRGAAQGQLLPLAIQKTHTQRRQQAGAAVVGRTAAQAQHNAPHSGIQRRANQLAGAMAAGRQHIAPARFNPVQAAGLGHLDNRLGIRQQPPMRLNRIAQRPADAGLLQLAAGSAQQRINRALTTVGHRAEQQFGIGVNARPARRDGFSNSAGTQAFLERIRGDNQFHQSSTRLSSQTVIMPAMPCIRVPRVCAR